jgi:hypothetical protein
MELEYNPVVFYILIIVGVIFISLAILFGLQIAYSVEVDSYKDCIEQELPPHICDMIYPPMKLQSVNYTILIPFP